MAAAEVAGAAADDRLQALRAGRVIFKAMQNRTTAALGAFLAAAAVALGAFGAHALEGHVSEARLGTFETAVRYLMYHALGLLLLSRIRGTGSAAVLMTAGVTVFSLSLILLVLTDTGWLGAITPLGGVLMIGAWLLTAWRLLRAERS